MHIMQELKKELLSGGRVSVIFLGDSITSTEWVHPNWREIVEYVLKEELIKAVGEDDWRIPSWGIRCFNFGFDGSTTVDLLDRVNDMLRVDPYVAIYLENTNEIHYDFTPQQHAKNALKLVNGLLKKCRHVIVCNSIAGNKKEYNKRMAGYAAAVREVRFDKRVTFIDTFSEYAKYDLDRFFTFTSEGNPFLGLKRGDTDFAHPNQLGNAYIAMIVLKKGFGIRFDPELYMKSTNNGEMFPRY